MNDPARGIEEFFRSRYDREALYVPSGRLALYLVFREWLHPGDRILLSPIDDDVVFFTVLAAGLVPVIGPLDTATGNLDPSAVDDRTWSRLNAVMTTNLYGIPDRMDLLMDRCRRHGILLIEDACQALDSRVGDRRIGQLSSVAAFSLSKHVPGVGGVLCFQQRERRNALVRRAEAEIHRRAPARMARDAVVLIARGAADRTGTRSALTRFRRAILPAEPEREGHRMPYDPARVLRAREDGGGLDRFNDWVRVDNSNYRTEPFRREIRTTLSRLQSFEDNRNRRIEGARKLFALGLTPPALRPPEGTALFRVPLFVAERDTVLARFAGRGLHLDYIYDPPLDLYAVPALAEHLASPDEARAWSRDILPVDPLLADRFISAMREMPGLRAPQRI